MKDKIIDLIDQARWQREELAPRNGSIVVLKLKTYPWPTIGYWNACDSSWTYLVQQVQPVEGKWNDYYYEKEQAKPGEVEGFMPLPDEDAASVLVALHIHSRY